MLLPAAYQQLVQALDQLPAVGPRAAARLAQHLLNSDAGAALLQALQRAGAEVTQCRHCRCYSNADLCGLCGNEQRDRTRWLVVAGVDELQQAEQAGWRGLCFVLHGLLAPMSGRGPNQLGLGQLQQRVATAARPLQITLALESTAEGRATAAFIASMLAVAGVEVVLQDWTEWLTLQEQA